MGFFFKDKDTVVEEGRMWKERNPRRGAVCLLKRKKNLGSARTQGRLTGQQNQAQSPSSCEHDDNSQFKGKE